MVDDHFIDRRAESDFDPDFAHESRQRLDKRSGPTHRKLNAPLAFEIVNERIDVRRIKRIAANQQGRDGKGAPQPGVMNVFRHQLPHLTVATQRD